MKPDQAFSELIGCIYDCALDGARWPGVLAELTQIVNGRSADLFVFNPLNGSSFTVALHNWPADLVELVKANNHLNPNAALGLIAPLCEPMCSTRDLDIAAFHRSRFWQRCFAGRGYYDHLAVPISRSLARVGTWGVTRDISQGPYGDEELEFARLIAPHIRRSVEISGVLGHARVQVGTLRSALDALAAAALIVEPDGAIRFRNAPAEAELERRTIFREKRGRLIGVTTPALQLVASFAAGGAARHQRGQDIRLADTAGRELQASWVDLDRAGEELGSPILILLRQPEDQLRTPLSAAASIYALTAGEVQVLAQIVEGRTLAEIAAILGVARSTVKTHLDAIYRKTNTHRQPELVRLTLDLASPLRR